MRPAAFLAAERASCNEASGESHVGEHAVAACLELDVAQCRDGALQAGAVALDADVLGERVRLSRWRKLQIAGRWLLLRPRLSNASPASGAAS